jgi:hypothetical protein
LSLICLYIILSMLSPNILRLRSSLNVSDHVLHLYNTTGKVIDPYTLILNRFFPRIRTRPPFQTSYHQAMYIDFVLHSELQTWSCILPYQHSLLKQSLNSYWKWFWGFLYNMQAIIHNIKIINIILQLCVP